MKNMDLRIVHLENELREQEKISILQESELKKMNEKLQSVYLVVEQLIPSLFDYRKQRNMFELHHDILRGCMDNTDEYYRSFSCNGGVYATTKQGYANEAKIEELEKMVQQLMKRNAEEEEKHEVTSTTSSVGSNSSEERIKASFCLCGNE
jgi:predicted metal-dependent hydrolase